MAPQNVKYQAHLKTFQDGYKIHLSDNQYQLVNSSGTVLATKNSQQECEQMYMKLTGKA